MDVALLSVLRDGLLRRSEAAALAWGDVELRENGTALINVRRSKTDPEAEGVTLYIGKQAGEALRASGLRRSCWMPPRPSSGCPHGRSAVW